MRLRRLTTQHVTGGSSARVGMNERTPFPLFGCLDGNVAVAAHWVPTTVHGGYSRLPSPPGQPTRLSVWPYLLVLAVREICPVVRGHHRAFNSRSAETAYYPSYFRPRSFISLAYRFCKAHADTSPQSLVVHHSAMFAQFTLFFPDRA